jgi:BirA family biotin operon repressor/biotin-[acetyl-CoA-carboxylase] ligase
MEIIWAMLNKDKLGSLLPVSGLGEPLYFYPEVESTNDIAIDLASQGASHGTLVVAEGQTAGRGQRGRKWNTVPGSGLALSIILRPARFSGEEWMKVHALGALAIVETLEKYGLEALIKWPNDVLLYGKKLAGILCEVFWEGEKVQFIVLGMGINVGQSPLLEHEDFDLPAIAIEEVLKQPLDWHELIKRILSSLGIWYSRFHQMQFIEEWEKRLAYRGEKVIVSKGDGKQLGKVIGLNENGALRILTTDSLYEINNGQAQIRLFEEDGKD